MTRLERFERHMALPMLLLSLILLFALILPAITSLDQTQWLLLAIIDKTLWFLFAVEYGIRLYLAENRRHFLRTNLIDLFIIALPLLRPLRLLAGTRALRALRIVRIITVGMRSSKIGTRLVTLRAVSAIVIVLGLLVTILALAVYLLEAHIPGSRIHTVGDAFWWGIVTLCTVGYGDLYPITTGGRIAASILMISGTCLTGLITAVLASIFVEKSNALEFEPHLRALEEHLSRMESAIADIERHREALKGHLQEQGEVTRPPAEA